MNDIGGIHMPRPSVLVIEDDRDTLDTVQLLLEQEGFTVIASDDCVSAFGYLTQNLPDVILTDLRMQCMTGLELIQRIRSIVSFDSTPIIAMSAYDRTYLKAAISAGAAAALHKPEDLDVLVETVNHVFANHSRGWAAGQSGR
jgi:CheY-like chemotaxis protein